MLLWPALWNGYPLLFPDTLQYVANGHGVWLKLQGQEVLAWMYTSMRSEIYAAGIFLLHQGVTLWPVVVAQALLTAWVVWLVVRGLCERPVRVYLTLVAVLSLLTSVAWYACFITPDILGPVLYLCIYLLVFDVKGGPNRLRVWEIVALALIAWWAAGTHATHLVLAAALLCLLTLLWLAGWLGMRRRGGRLLLVAGILLLTAGAQTALHARLYGRASLFGKPPPFLMARLIADGPARVYLQHNCGHINWMICHYANVLPTTDADFLWTQGGIWQSATPDQQQHLLSEQMPLARVTLEAYPLQQAEKSVSNFLRTLVSLGPREFGSWSGVFTATNLDFMLPGSSALYPRTRQAHDAMQQAFFRGLQIAAIVCSVAIVAVLLPWFWRRRSADSPQRLLGLASVVLFVVPANALLSGALSGVYSRYQGRVVWLVAMLAGLMVCGYAAQRRQETEPEPARWS